MDVQVKSAGGLMRIPLETRLLAKRRVFLQGEINEASADEFCKMIIYLNDEDPHEPIYLAINSPGGKIKAGLMIYDIIQSSTAPIKILCTEQAYSMAAILLACGAHGRYILPHGEVMIHEPLLAGDISDRSATSIKSISDNIMAAKAQIDRLLAIHTGKTLEEIEAATSHDHFMTAKEAVAFGICDGVTTFSKFLEV